MLKDEIKKEKKVRKRRNRPMPVFQTRDPSH
jgi:hypothetical protein